MTKAEMKKIVSAAIKECNLNGYRWKFDGEKLHWNYLTVEHFIFDIADYGDFVTVQVLYVQPHFDTTSSFAIVFAGENGLVCDCTTVEEAVAMVTKMTINKANHLF